MAAKPSSETSPDDALQDVTVINDEDLAFGLPRTLFWGGVALTLGFAFVFKSIFYITSPLFALVYFTAMYAIHKDDPRGGQGWARALRRGSTWSGGSYKSRRVRYLQERE